MKKKSIMFQSVKVITLAVIAIGFMATKCNRPESVGPYYKAAPENFKVISFSVGSPTVNFSTPAGMKDTFYASFSHEVSWTINLTGTKSGAVSKLTGTSQVIDGSNPSWLWDGSHDELNFFMKNEPVEAVITFLGSGIKSRDTVTIINTKSFKDYLITDFESGGALNGQWPNWIAGPAGGYVDGDPGAGGDYIDTADADPADLSKKFMPVQGIRAYSLYGTDANNSYFVSGIRREKFNTSTWPSDPDSVYLNIYIYGLGNANSRLNFGVQEDDFDNTLGTHQPTSDDEFQTQITLDHVGWKLFSFKYSDLVTVIKYLGFEIFTS